MIRTRKGMTVEVGNTDAEGRLVLCDLLADACDESPTLLIDCATLTGAARVALGPDLPAMFCNDDGWADQLLRHGQEQHDPLWRLPLWAPYDRWLDSPVADLNNVSSKPHAGAITAALFLQRFVAPGIAWAHFDLYAWNDQTSPGHPEGGEAYAMRALFAALAARAKVRSRIEHLCDNVYASDTKKTSLLQWNWRRHRFCSGTVGVPNRAARTNAVRDS